MGSGSEEPRTRLFLQYQRMLRAFIRTLIPSVDDAEDLLQEVGLVVLRSGNELMEPQAFRPWARGVAKNLILHHWRARRRSKEVPSERYLELIDAAYARLESETDVWNERARALSDCMSKLGEPSRDLLERRYLRNLRSDVIGRETGRTAAAVRKMLERVRESLQRCIEARVAEGTRAPLS
jgi:RNA polymerase sigma-70 factor (ECF subfamily)